MKTDIEQEITNIFITIDNYGTAEEARADIRKLISEQTTLARTEVYGEIKNMFLSEFYEMLKDVQTDMEKP